MLLVSFNAHTCVGDQDWFIPRDTMAIVPGVQAGDQEAHKRLTSSFSRPQAALAPCPSRRRWPPSQRPAGRPRPRHHALMRCRRRRRRRRCRRRHQQGGCGGCGGCGCGGAGCFPGGVVFYDFFLCQRCGRRCRTFRVGEELDLPDEDVPEECVPHVIGHAFEVRHSPLVGS